MAMHNKSAVNRTTEPESTVMNANIEIQHAIQSGFVPEDSQIKHWVISALNASDVNKFVDNETEVTIRITSEQEITELNKQYRQQDKATNVLSFPYEPMPGVNIPLLGDIVICAEVVNKEALEQNKSCADHWAHMVIHGVLHLLGLDHIADDDAEYMEACEIKILQNIGIANPYQVNDDER